MDRRTFIAGVAGGALATSLDSFAQEQARIWRVGVLSTSKAVTATAIDLRRREAFDAAVVELPSGAGAPSQR